MVAKYKETLRIEKIVDLCMSAFEIYTNTDSKKYSTVTDKLLEFVAFHCNTNMTDEILNYLISYANLYYVRKQSQYPLQIFCTLRIILSSYILNQDKYIEMIVKAITKKGDSKLVSTLLVILDYFVQSLPDKDDIIEKPRRDMSVYERIHYSNGPIAEEALFHSCAGGITLAEQIFGICLYILTDIDWTVFDSQSREELLKLIEERATQAKTSKRNESLLLFLMSLSVKSKEMITDSLLESIFTDDKKFEMGNFTYKALMAAALGQAQDIANEYNLYIKAPEKKTSKIIQSESALKFVLKQINLYCDKEIITDFISKLAELMNNEKFLEEFTRQNELAQLVFELKNKSEVIDKNNPKLVKIYASLLCQLEFRYCLRYWQSLSQDNNHKLIVLSEALDIALSSFNNTNEKNNIVIGFRCIAFTYAMENIVVHNTPVETVIKVLAKLMLFLDKADALYISVPVWSILENRGIRHSEDNELLQREGGILRILLKIITILLKKDKTELSCCLMRYLLFRQKECRSFIKKQVDKTWKLVAKTKQNYQKRQSLLNLFILQDSEAIRQYNLIQEFYYKKVIGNETSILDNRKVSKSAPSLLKQNYFGSSACLVITIFCHLFQLIHFELLKVERYSEDIIKVFNNYQDKKPEITERFKQVVCILKEIIMKGIPDNVSKILIDNFHKLMNFGTAKTKSTSNVSLTVGNSYSILNSSNDSINEKEELKLSDEMIDQFDDFWDDFINSFLSSIKISPDISTDCDVIMSRLLRPESVTSMQPILMYFTVHSFRNLDLYIQSRNDLKMMVEKDTTENKIVQTLREKIQNNFTHIYIPKAKIGRDELRMDFDFLARSICRKTLHDQYSVLGCWFKQAREKSDRQLYAYIKRRYKKMMRKCPLYKKLHSDRRLFANSYTKFIKLSMKNDKLGRFMTVKPLKNMENHFNLGYTYQYLKLFVLKKMLIRRMACKVVDMNDFYMEDFKYELMAKVFKNQDYTLGQKQLGVKAEESVGLCSCSIDSKDDTTSESELSVYSTNDAYNEDDIPRRVKTYDAEMITIKGAIFGRITVNSVCLSFRDSVRKSEEKFKYGSTVYNQLNNTKVNCKWKLEEISEIVVKRYNLMRQAFEVYFHNSHSVLFSMFSPEYLHRFLSAVKVVVRKKNLKIDIITDPEETFKAKNYSSKWAAGDISNFEYLMLLNKYGGRSFNDLNQYPVFPWIIKNYESNLLSLEDNSIYRPLGVPMAAMTQEKKLRADEKLRILKNESEKYQFGAHYLPARIVLGYLLRLEPYASVLMKFEHGYDASQRLFHYMKDTWSVSLLDFSDNKELVPEFFYLPEVFGNYNLCSYGRKEIEDFDESVSLAAYSNNLLRTAKTAPGEKLDIETAQSCIIDNYFECSTTEKSRSDLAEQFMLLPQYCPKLLTDKFGVTARESRSFVRVDQVVLPPWAKSNHEFIRINAMALESAHVSLELDKWIDLIFGSLQQSTKHHNMFKLLCDESSTQKIFADLTESQLTELQEFGVNPIKLFRNKHPQKSLQTITERTEHMVFRQLEGKAKRLFILSKICKFPKASPVIYLESFEKRVVAILNTQKLYLSKEGLVNLPHEKSVSFEKKEVELFPFECSYNETHRIYEKSDSDRCFVCFNSGTSIFTCRHYDNTFKRINAVTGAVEESIKFHSAMVVCICATQEKDKVFSGSKDGVVAMWILKKEVRQLAWYATNHNGKITSIDCCESMNMLATAGKDGNIVLRRITNGKLVNIIKPGLSFETVLFEITHVRLSYRGYIVSIAQCKKTARKGDLLFTYSINGEKLCEKRISDIINALILSETGYEFIVCGRAGKLSNYQLLTLEEENILIELDKEHPGIDTTLEELLEENSAITAICLTAKEGYQQILIGTSTGSVFAYKYSPRIITSRIFDKLAS